MKHLYQAAAREELLEAAEWYLEHGGVDVAEQFESALARALSLLKFMPQIGTQVYPGVRLLPLMRFPYTLVYACRAASSPSSRLRIKEESRATGKVGTEAKVARPVIASLCGWRRA